MRRPVRRRLGATDRVARGAARLGQEGAGLRHRSRSSAPPPTPAARPKARSPSARCCAPSSRRGKMLKLLDDVELPLARVLAVMEHARRRLDVAVAAHARARRRSASSQTIEAEVQALAGSDINLGSPKQLQELLFDKLGLPGIKRTKTGWSTDADVLEELAPLHPVAAKILEHRVLAKLKGTYIDALPRGGRSQGRAAAHLVSADGGRDGAAVVDGAQPAERADPHRARARDPARLRRRRRLRAHRRRLLADRAARPGAPVEGSGAPRRLRQGRGHPPRARSSRCSAPTRPTTSSCARWPR